MIATPENFSEGLVITLVGYSIVFSALVTLFFVFNSLSKVLNTKIRNRLRKEGKHEIADLPNIDVTGEETAAVAMALYLMTDVHDEESGVITIKRDSKTYSPWSSKIYGLRRFSR
ncbi:MAG: hypothetical protein CL663_02340 [Bacteroidetes bacterium]|nr:hypothetical protein [Bacteroidota bacterium]